MFRTKSSPFIKLAIKLILMVTIFAIIIAVSFGSNILVKQIIEREREALETYADIYRHYITTDDVENALFFLEKITPTLYFPMIITDAYDEPIQDYQSFSLNIDELGYISSIEEQRNYLVTLIKQMQQDYAPIVMPDEDGKILAKFYFSHSRLVDLLRFFPLGSVLIVISIVFIGYFAFNAARNNEQSRIWVGMAREAAHQLGTPISSLLAWIELLKLNKDQPEAIIDTAVEIENDVYLLNLIATRFSKIGSKPDMKEINISEKINDVCNYYERRLPHLAGKVTLIRNYDHCIMIRANDMLISWVFENLIKNGVEAMEGKCGEMTISAHNISKNKIQFLVKDTGKGMNAKMKYQIFEPGFTTKKRGWGIGLSLVKRIIEEYHLGKIYVKESAIGKGTTFAIELSK